MILKVATGVQNDGTVNWKDLYANAIRLRLRRDKNLSDVADAKKSRDNLGVTKAITEAQQEAIDISIEYARTHDDLIWERLDSRMSKLTEDMLDLQNNIGTWNYIDYENKVVENLNFVDYTKNALQNLFSEIGDNEVVLRQYIEDVSDDTYKRIVEQMDLHYVSLNDLIKIWWEMFQDNLKRDINIMQRTLEISETQTDLRLDAIEEYCAATKSYADDLKKDLSTTDDRITRLRNNTKTGFQDVLSYLSKVVSALSEYNEEVMRVMYGELQKSIEALNDKIKALEKWKAGYPGSDTVVTISYLNNTFRPDLLRNYIPKVWNSEGKLEFYYKGKSNGQSPSDGQASDTSVTPHDIFWIDS